VAVTANQETRVDSTGEIARLERRLQALERRNRWTTAICALLGVFALAAFTQRQEQVVRAERFELLNAQGQVAGQWGMERGGPVLQMGTRQATMIRLGVNAPDDAGLQIGGPEGSLRVDLGLMTGDATGLMLNGPNPGATGPASGITLLHAPAIGPMILLQEQGRALFEAPVD
jgi:hypothetical protein